jgi:hypothetical protein
MPKYRKKSVVIEAVQWTGDNQIQVFEVTNRILYPPIRGSSVLIIPTLRGYDSVEKGDWIIKGIDGKIYMCKPDIFEQTYELIEMDNENN